MLRRAVMGTVTAAVALTTVLSAVPAAAVEEPSNSGINFELPQRWNDDYKPDIHTPRPLRCTTSAGLVVVIPPLGQLEIDPVVRRFLNSTSRNC